MKLSKALLLAMLALIGLAAIAFALLRLGAPAGLLLLVIGAAGLLLWNKVKRDPYVGWGYLRVFGWMAALASGAWTLIGFVASGLLVAVPLAAVFVGSVFWIQFCSRKIDAAITRDARSIGARAS